MSTLTGLIAFLEDQQQALADKGGALYRLDCLPNLPVIVFSSRPQANLMLHLVAIIGDLKSMLDRQTGPVFVIFHAPDLVLDMQDMLNGARLGARGRHAVLHHPNIRESIFVLADPAMRNCLKALRSATFGFVRYQAFAALDEAFEYCYEKLGIIAPP